MALSLSVLGADRRFTPQKYYFLFLSKIQCQMLSEVLDKLMKIIYRKASRTRYRPDFEIERNIKFKFRLK